MLWTNFWHFPTVCLSVSSKDTTTAREEKESNFQFRSLTIFFWLYLLFQGNKMHSLAQSPKILGVALVQHSCRYRRTNFWFLSHSRGEAACYTMITVVTTRSLTTSKHMTAMTASSTWLTHISLELAGQKSRPLHIHHGRNTLQKPPAIRAPANRSVRRPRPRTMWNGVKKGSIPVNHCT